ncbi:MAG: hypothetical protein DLM67_01805 [Candidatus Nephthysia bennettiae]|uniref:LPXTG cell wall anchor domain-containing protein n=1 Tax=Candidatus Nephthysia bennettiae TaxID=3127016 RepID=A0A934KDL9_9BACT|nr:hypothetical protein [Candidatus Dormibacteraeota bacterium]MBJ7611558.1 hypothetical protein [Candidatus Dormibacteraeota bacterium]PZS00279.1 MAG: hypothetical protein DLM67_01805 [Candidatus Dormibacteraeota bacterium]
MTRIKAVSALAVAFVLTAFGAISAFAWAPITPSADCHTVTVTADDSGHWYTDHPNGVLLFKQGGTELAKPFHFDSLHPDKPIVTLTVDATKKDHIGPGDWTVEVVGDHSTMKSFTVPTCETPTPTPTTKPSASATATPSATTEPSASATATPSATSSTQPTSTSVPSPPVTGQGSNGGDNNFGVVLLVMVVGTVAIGGTTLALSRKGS